MEFIKHLVGYFNTKDTTSYGKDEKGRKCYLFTPFQYPEYQILIPYSGNLSGKIIANVNQIIEKENRIEGKILKVLGQYSEDLIDSVLLSLSQQLITFNPCLFQREDKLINDSNLIVSIDPPFSSDVDKVPAVDDALSFNKNTLEVFVYLAFPVWFLSDEEIIKRKDKMVSTLYSDETRYHLWGDEITESASLLQNKIRPALRITIYNKKLKEISLVKIKNHHTGNYHHFNQLFKKDKCNYPDERMILDLHQFTDYKLSAEKLVEYYMVLTNQLLTQYFLDNNLPLISRYFSNNNFSIHPDEEINRVFNYRMSEKALYKINDSIGTYGHFTSPIRRWVDTWHQLVLYYFLMKKEKLTWDILNLEINQLNYSYQQVRKFHDNYQIKQKVIVSKKYQAYVFDVKKTGKIEVYLPEINLFLKGYLFPKQLAFQYHFEKITKEKEGIDVEEFYQFKPLISDIPSFIIPINQKIEIEIINTGKLLYSQRYTIKF